MPLPVGVTLEILCEDLHRVVTRLAVIAREHGQVDAKLEAEIELALQHIARMWPEAKLR